MEQQYWLTIVITMYNLETEISRCLHSVANQIRDKNDIEVLLIDDGSTDNTAVIAKRYATYVPSMHYLYKRNGGVSSARNYGLDNAKACYIWFVDGDDKLEDDAIEHLRRCINDKSDILTFDFIIFDDFKKIYVSKKEKLLPYNMFTGIDYLRNFYVSAIWQHIYKKDFLIKNGIRFQEGLVHEDNEFDLRTMALAQYVYYVNIPIYVYYKNNTRKSLSKSKSLRDACSVYPLIITSEYLERKTTASVVARQGAFVLNVILACDYSTLSNKDKFIFRKEFITNAHHIRYCYLHSDWLIHKAQGLLMYIHPMFLFNLWMLLLAIKNIYENSFYNK